MGVYAAFWQNAYIVYKEVASDVAFIADGPTCSDTEIDSAENIGKLHVAR